jgi:hypothetical protein
MPTVAILPALANGILFWVGEKIKQEIVMRSSDGGGNICI